LSIRCQQVHAAGTTPTLDLTIALDRFAGYPMAFSYARRTLTTLDADSLLRLTKGRRSVPIHLVLDAEGLALAVNIPVPTPQRDSLVRTRIGYPSPFLLIGKHLARLFALDGDSKNPQPLQAALGDGNIFRGSAKVLNLTLTEMGVSFLPTMT